MQSVAEAAVGLGGQFEWLTPEVLAILVPDCVGTRYLALFGEVHKLLPCHLRRMRKRWREAARGEQIWALVQHPHEIRFAAWFGFVPNGTLVAKGVSYKRMTYGPT